MRITAKGQVTIPLAIREKAGLMPHTEVEFEFDGKTVQIRPTRHVKRPSRGQKLVAHMRGRANAGLSTDEIMALTRGDDRE